MEEKKKADLGFWVIRIYNRGPVVLVWMTNVEYVFMGALGLVELS